MALSSTLFAEIYFSTFSLFLAHYLYVDVHEKTYFIGTIEARGNNFIYDIHKIFCFSDDMVDFDKSCCFANSWIFDSKLKCLHICWHLVQLIE